jgi:D-glycero-alpha-D-manno-heptose-7-phosphate kinase
MIITQAPVRISFLGGGSDYPGHFERFGGAVLATAVDRFAYVTVQPFNHQFFEHGLRVAYRRTEDARCPEDIQHPAIRACFEKLGIAEGVELHHMADLPARTGLGSSSSFVVAMLQALHAHRGAYRSPRAVAEEAIEIERYILAEAGGFQDQIIAAYGGTCLIRFNRTGDFTVTQLPLSRCRIDELRRHMLLLYTGIQRESYTVASRQVARMDDNHSALSAMSNLADEGADVLLSGAPLERFGELLHTGWELKKQLTSVTLPEIDAMYAVGLEAGAWGGKILGAGQGGFLLLLAPPDRHEEIQAALPDVRMLRVGINAPGSRIIFASN